MKKLFFVFVAVLCVVANAHAGKGYTNDTAPSTCVDGDFWIDTNGTSAERFHVCEEGTWVKHLGNGTTSNPSFLSVHASGGNLAAANAQVTKKWITGLSYTADVTSVIHGGKHWIAKTTHTAGSTTEPGVGASYSDAWKEDPAAFNEAGDYSPTGSWDFTGATVSGLSGGSYTEGTGITISAGTISVDVGTGANQIVQLNADGELPFDIPSKANVSCFASESAFNACFDLTWASGSAPPSGTGIVVVADGSYGTPLSLDTDLASVSANDDSVPSAKATKAAIDAVALGGVTVQADDPTSASSPGWYAATGSGDIFYKSSAGLFTIAGSYVADPVVPTLTSRTIGTDGTTLTLSGSASLSIGAGGNGGFDVDCVTAGNGITATYDSGAPGTDLVYTLGTTVNSGDTCDLDYTQPGNGIEATTGGADLASITSGAITNNSTQSAGIAYDAESSFSDGYTSATETFSHTVGSGANRILIVGVATRGAEAVSAMTYNGVSMTRLDGITPGNIHTAVWYLVNPDSGTHDISMTCTTTLIVDVNAVSYSGVNQSTPFGTLNKTSGTATSSSAAVSSATGETVIDFVSVRNGDTLTVGADQTSVIETKQGTNVSTGVSVEAGAATTTMTWSWINSVTWSQIAVPIKPAS